MLAGLMSTISKIRLVKERKAVKKDGSVIRIHSLWSPKVYKMENHTLQDENLHRIQFSGWAQNSQG